jgi:outer membrane cobalamin receptor
MRSREDPETRLLSLLPLFTFILMSPHAGESQLAVEDPERVIAVEEMVVTATRTDQTVRDIPANVTVLTMAEIRRSAAQTLDDLLRQVPGFSLFRRSSSVVAHPTTQGVSLRGIGASGSSRTLVLLDGMPLNDPFGGWVQWGKVRVERIEHIEVLRGGGSHIWGNYALGGVIHITTVRPQKRTVTFSGQVGGRKTATLDISLSDRFGSTGLTVEGSHFTTEGYPIVRADQRGAIDGNADSKNTTIGVKLTHDLSPTANLYLHGSVFREDRNNGTPLARNSTDAGYVGMKTTLRTSDGSKWTFVGFSQFQTFTSSFSSPAPGRNSESPALNQFDVPSRAVGLTAEWLKPINVAHLVTAGSDVRWLSGETNEDFRFISDRFTRRRRAGGDQLVMGIYVQDIVIPQPRWQVTVGGRVDLWRSVDASRLEWDRETGQSIRDDRFAGRGHWVFNPKAGLRFNATDRVSFRTSGYRTFRTPTLNELFRPFRVQNDITEANEHLNPERLLGGEVGGDYVTPSLTGRLTAYWNEVEGAVVNLTIGSGPGQVPPCGFVPEGGRCRQRHNLNRTRTRGIEAEITCRSRSFWTGSVGYLFNDSRVVSAPTQPDLEGKRIPQVPAHHLIVKIGYTNPALFDASVQGQVVSNQFEDDINSLGLGDSGLIDLSVGRHVQTRTEVFFHVENLFNRSYVVGKTGDGLVTNGAPRLFHGGVRMRL